MSSPTTVSVPPRTMKSGSTTGARFRSGMRPHNHAGSLVPEPLGHRWGLVELVSQEVLRVKGYRHVQVRCTSCGATKAINYANLRKGKTKGCQSCSQKCGAPVWLLQRMEAARQRCTNPNDAGYPRYGGRGVQFRFPTVAAGAVWVKENLGLERSKELDRRNNDGHYEAGNLRWVSRKVNIGNQTRSRTLEFHTFRLNHPEVRYADTTLRALIARGLTPEQIVQRWARPSCKPKGVYGTCSTADPEIVLQLTTG